MTTPVNFKFFSGEQQLDFDDVFVQKCSFIDRSPWVWGNNAAGQLGDNSTISESSPVQTVTSGIRWQEVSAGSFHSAAIKTDGTLWLWGCNSDGQLGTNSTISQSSSVQTVSTGNNWKQVSLGGNFSASIKTDGTLWLWGCGYCGRLGNNSTTFRSSPVQTVSQGTDWKQVSLGSSHSAAIKTDGTLWLWGLNTNIAVSGLLGTNLSNGSLSSPVQTVSTGNNWKQVSLRCLHSAAIKTDGTLWLWGNGTCGRLGNESSTNQSSPVQTVSTGINWKQVSLGGAHSAAVKTDGTLWVWGEGGNGRLGNNLTTNQSSPVQTVSTGNNWKQVSLGNAHSAAIKTDGTLWLWGSGGNGSLGNNLAINQSSPVQTVSTGTNWLDISLGSSHSTSLREENYW